MVVQVTVDDNAVGAKYKKLPEELRGTLRETIPPLTRKLADRVRAKLAPGVLFKTTTNLLPAVRAVMIENTKEIFGRVYIDPARFPEVVAETLEGGSKAHIIRAKNASALFFFWEKLGKNVAFKEVHHPGFEGRSYMKSTSEEFLPEMTETMRLAILGKLNA